MSLFLDIGTGAGLAAATGVRPVPAAAPRRRRSRAATSGIDFDGTDCSFLESPAFLAAVLALASWLRRRTSVRPRRSGHGRPIGRGPAESSLACSALVLGALLFAGSLADGGYAAGSGSSSGPLCAAPRLARGGRRCWSARRRGSTPAQAGLAHGVRGRGRARARGRRDLRAAARVPGARRLRRAAARRPAPRGREVRGPADPAGDVAEPKKLVLAVIDSLKPEMLDRAIEEGQRAGARGAPRARHLRPRLRLDLPVGHAGGLGGDRDRRGPGEHHIPSMNWYHRGEERYVEYGSSFAGDARVRRRPLALRHGLQHEHGAPEPGAADRVRAPRRRRAAHGLHHLPDLPRPHAPRARRGRASTGGSPRRPSSATRSTAPRELFYADLFASRDTGCTLDARHARASATATPAAWAPTWSSTTCSTSCSSRCPTTTPTRTRSGPDGQVRSIAEADRALERIMHVAGGVDAFLEEHAVIVMSDHSQTAVEQRDQPRRGARRRWRVLTPADVGADRGGAGGLPGGALGDGLRARRGAPRASSCRRAVDMLAELDGRRPRDQPRGRRGASVRSGRGRAALRPGGELTDARGAALEREGDEARARAGRGRRRRSTSDDVPGRARPALVGARVPARRRRARLGRRSATSSWTGAAPTTWAAAATARSTAATRRASCSSAGSTRPEREQWSLADVTPLVLDHFGVPLPA